RSTRAPISHTRRSSCCVRARSPSRRPGTYRSSSTANRSERRRPASRSSPPRCDCVSQRRAALLSCAFTALAVLVAVGAFTRADQWAVDHLMPGASFHHAQGGLLNGLVPLLHSRWDSPYAVAANIITLPASFLF